MKKKIIILVAISLISAQLAHMQAQPWLINGTSIYYNAGKVGIGTASPQSVFHVAGTQSINWQENDDAKGTGLVTIGDRAGNGSLFINTPTHNPYYPSGLGIDGSYNSDVRNSLINIKAFGVKYSSWNSSLAFHTSNGTGLNEAMRIDASGRIGIGTTTPQSKLHVTGYQSITWSDIYTDGLAGTGLVTVGDKGGNGSLFINTPTHSPTYPSGLGIDGSYNSDSRLSLINIKAYGVKYSSWHSSLAFHTSNGTSLIEAMRIDAGGNVGIGTIVPAYKLDVCGTIRAKEVKVDLQGSCMPDFVFAPTYQLRPLSEVEKYVKANSHLPEIPSAAEVAQNGLNLGDMQNKLLQKVEELTLYTIEQDKKLIGQNQQLQDQNKKIDEQEKKNMELQQKLKQLEELINQKLK